jgi:hypothetical protein
MPYWKEIHELLSKDHIIPAILLYREKNPDVSLRDAKNFIEGVSFGMILERKSASWQTEKK